MPTANAAVVATASNFTFSDPYQWLEIRSTNTIGRPDGLRQVIGIDSAKPNGLRGTTAVAMQGGAVLNLPFTGSSAIPNEFSTSIAADPALYGSWTLAFANGASTASVATPSIAAGLTPMPFVSDVTISSGATTRFSWQLPSSSPSPIDAVRINLYDHGRLNKAGTAVDTVYNVTLAPTATSFTLPPLLATGLPLTSGDLYTLEVSLLSYGAGVRGPQSDLRNRSRDFVDFVGGGTSGEPVFLPVVAPGSAGAAPVFHFDISSVGSARIFIDPVVAVGYRYQTGAGNPNFSSVLLPSGIGDNRYQIVLADGQQFEVTGGDVFNFASGGVGSFTVLGIEASAGLNPNDATGFVSGLTFAGQGAFTGTMTAVLTAVPEPGTSLLWVVGLAGLATARRGRSRAESCPLSRRPSLAL